jgi:hypothetical protein
MAQGGNSDLSLRHDLFRAFCCEADQSGTHGWRNKRCCVECNTEHCEAAGEIAANGKTKLAQHIYHVHMIPLPGDYRRRGRGLDASVGQAIGICAQRPGASQRHRSRSCASVRILSLPSPRPAGPSPVVALAPAAPMVLRCSHRDVEIDPAAGLAPACLDLGNAEQAVSVFAALLGAVPLQKIMRRPPDAGGCGE